MNKPKTKSGKKALMLASVASMIDLFNRDNIKILQELGYNVEVATNFSFGSITSKEAVRLYMNELDQQGIKYYNTLIPRNLKSIKAIKNSYKEIKQIIDNNNYDIVHCHSPIGGFLCRLACRKARKTNNLKVVYTGHGFHFYKGAPIKNWIIYYTAEWIASFWTDLLITINEEDYQRSKNHFHAKAYCKVPGIGVDVNKFKNKQVDKLAILEDLNIPNNSKILISVGEINENKNHQIVIKAMNSIDDDSIHYILVGIGPEQENLENLIKELGLNKRVHMIGFKKDVGAYHKISDLFIFPSIREGFGLALLEAVASGVYSIASDTRGPREILNNNDLFDAKNVKAVADMISDKLNCSNTGQKTLRPLMEYDCSSVEKIMRAQYKTLLNV